MIKAITKFPCPICRNGEGVERYTELGLERHLALWHKRVDSSDLTDKWVSNRLAQYFHTS